LYNTAYFYHIIEFGLATPTRDVIITAADIDELPLCKMYA